MLLDFKKLFYKYQMGVTGIIHVGAHYGQEYEIYVECGVEKVIFVEACEAAFNVLFKKFLPLIQTKKVICINCACGDRRGVFEMFTSKDNKGMSNSLLEPALHKTQYPDIVFTDKEQVFMDRLDTLVFDHVPRYMNHSPNMLVMDVQGFEGFVLKGASETLKHIDYVYTEVNNAEVYKNCTKVYDLDALLSDFERVETSWAGKTWGDALYIRKSKLNKLL